MEGIRFLSQLGQDQLAGKIVFYRPDWNLPLSRSDGQPTSWFRLNSCLPTIRHLLDVGVARIIIGFHLDPWVDVDPMLTQDSRMSNKVIMDKLIQLFPDIQVIGSNGWSSTATGPGRICVLQNLRFNTGEKKNDGNFAEELAKGADIIVTDALGAGHRAHASTDSIFGRKPAVAGLLFEKELQALTKMLTSPQRPFIVMMGGAKLRSKLSVIRQLLPIVDKLLLGGAMAYTFINAKNIAVGRSLVEPNYHDVAVELLAEYSDKIILPIDVVGAAGGHHSYPLRHNVVGCDIGSDTLTLFKTYLSTANTIFWNGPLGIYEKALYRCGTELMAIYMNVLWKQAVRIIAGGDITAAFECENRLKYFIESGGITLTAGGAGLEFIEKFGTGVDLPTIAALKENKKDWADDLAHRQHRDPPWM